VRVAQERGRWCSYATLTRRWRAGLSQRERRFALPLVLGASLIYVGLVGSQLDRPLMYDDANFALAARAVADTGLPYGNQGWMSERGDFSQREQWALWHPPLYVYLEGVLARLGGWTPPVLRLLGLVGGLLSALLTYLLARTLTRGPPVMQHVAGSVAASLFLVCPLVVQSTLILDIDFPLLLPLALLFLLAYLRLEGTRRQWLWLAPLFAVLLWAKMTNPLPLLVVVAVWQLLRGHVLRAARHLVGIGLAGAAVFGGSWLLVGRWLGFPLDMPFGVNLVQWQDSAEVARAAYTSPGAFIEGLQPTVLWLGPGLAALGSIGLAVRVAGLTRCWRFVGADLLIGLLAVFVLGYVNKYAGWFPKYQVSMAPLLACLGAPLVAHAWCTRPRVTVLSAVAALALGAAITLGLIRDDWALQRTWAIQPVAGAWLLGGVVMAAIAGPRARAAAPAVIAAVLGITLGWSLGLDVYQATAAYQTDYWYGTTGTPQAADWVTAHLGPDDAYVAAKEVAIRSRDQRYVDQDNLVYFLNAGRGFDGTWAGEPLRALVLWQREPYTAALFNRVLPARGFHPVERFGDYVIYVPDAS
jgi:4-amino-4-deoxy-L-arabinose transferase-like glycosyltransferase